MADLKLDIYKAHFCQCGHIDAAGWLKISSVFPQCYPCASPLLSRHAAVSAASLLSDDVSSEDCLWRGKLKDI